MYSFLMEVYYLLPRFPFLFLLFFFRPLLVPEDEAEALIGLCPFSGVDSFFGSADDEEEDDEEEDDEEELSPVDRVEVVEELFPVEVVEPEEGFKKSFFSLIRSFSS